MKNESNLTPKGPEPVSEELESVSGGQKETSKFTTACTCKKCGHRFTTTGYVGKSERCPVCKSELSIFF